MPQAYLGERVQTMFRPAPDLRRRLDKSAFGAGYGKRKTSRYLVDLLEALHPDPRQHKKAATVATRLIKALVETASDLRADGGEEPVPTNVRASHDLRRRLELGAQQASYRKLNPYLVDLLAALHPDPDEHPEAAAAATRLVQGLLRFTATVQRTDGEAQVQHTLDFDLPAALAADSTRAAGENEKLVQQMLDVDIARTAPARAIAAA
ncbi:MAG: hypothetical protein HOZ81_40735 [Streptomyces sp.]|nr:hypothetical protein [Streptomyces sp.]